MKCILNIRTFWVLVHLFISIFISQTVNACQVPVFRYALERWTSDKYELAVFFNDRLNEDQEALVSSLDINANIEILRIDVKNMSGSEIAKYGNVLVPEGKVIGQLHYPWSVGRGNRSINPDVPLWKGELTTESLGLIIDSPVRKSIREKIISGESAVWVILGSGDKEKDLTAEKELKEYLQKVSQKIEIPEGVVGPGELDRVASGEVDVEDVLRSTIPLKISFDVIRIEKGDPREKIFSLMLTSYVPHLTRAYPNQNLIFPVFGRGRTLEAIPASVMTEEIMMKACTYICGACSCEVKRENPGIDLVMTASWQDALVGSEVVVDKILPPLTGVGDLVQTDEVNNTFEGLVASENSPNDDLNLNIEDELIGQFPINWIIGSLLLAVLSVILFMSIKISRGS